MSFYQRHIFFCNNVKDGEQCCSQFGAKDLYSFAKSKIRDQGLLGKENLELVSQDAWVDVSQDLWQ